MKEIPEENLREIYVNALGLQKSLKTAIKYDITIINTSIMLELSRIMAEVEFIQVSKGRKPFKNQLLFEPEIKS